MQYSFGAIIEVWLSGILFLTTTVLLLLRVSLGISDYDMPMDSIEKLIPIFTILLCSFAYSIGWIVNHIAESIFDPLLQHRFRSQLEAKYKISFFDIRAFVFQYASDHTLNDIKYDRQTIRIARANCFNFFIMSLVILSYVNVSCLPLILILLVLILCLLASCGAFFQWKCRYEATYKKFYQVYFVLYENITKK